MESNNPFDLLDNLTERTVEYLKLEGAIYSLDYLTIYYRLKERRAEALSRDLPHDPVLDGLIREWSLWLEMGRRLYPFYTSNARPTAL